MTRLTRRVFHEWSVQFLPTSNRLTLLINQSPELLGEKLPSSWLGIYRAFLHERSRAARYSMGRLSKTLKGIAAGSRPLVGRRISRLYCASSIFAARSGSFPFFPRHVRRCVGPARVRSPSPALGLAKRKHYGLHVRTTRYRWNRHLA